MARPHAAHLSRDWLQQQSAICLLLLNILDDNVHYPLNIYDSISLPSTFGWEQVYTAVIQKNRCSTFFFFFCIFLRKRAPLINITCYSPHCPIYDDKKWPFDAGLRFSTCTVGDRTGRDCHHHNRFNENQFLPVGTWITISTSTMLISPVETAILVCTGRNTDQFLQVESPIPSDGSLFFDRYTYVHGFVCPCL